MCLYRAVDSRGQTIDFLLAAKRDAEAAKRFFRKALAQPHTFNPRTITVEKNAARGTHRSLRHVLYMSAILHLCMHTF
jgi:transposase-like protein